MIPFVRFTLGNGLRVLVNTDTDTPLVSMALGYDVGAKDESEHRTGFAHLFEHLMFGGSVNVPDFDTPMQLAGGESNAFTSNDITCYHCTIPAANVETAFWLESDRMLSLAFTPQSLEVQRKVVIEEFKQHYLNAPYGDVSHLLFGLAYRVHPYRWPTIGLTPEHVAAASLDEVKEFFAAHYKPSNAVLALSGRITPAEALVYCERWFSPISSSLRTLRSLPVEPEQTETRRMTVVRNVPSDALFMAFHMCGSAEGDYPIWDVISDILSHGRSSRFTLRLVEDRALFAEISAVVTGSVDPGLFIVQGVLQPGVSISEAEEAVWKELRDLVNVREEEVEKVQNKFIATTIFEDISIQSRAQTLVEYELKGGAELANARVERQLAVTREQVAWIAERMLIPENCSVLHYMKGE